MALERYTSDSILQGGKILGTNGSILRIREAVALGQISFQTVIIQDGDRLDAIAGRIYGDGRLWWVIAAASNIGWWMQVPPGTRIVVPSDLTQVESYL